jgi:hypothetical protein
MVLLGAGAHPDPGGVTSEQSVEQNSEATR